METPTVEAPPQLATLPTVEGIVWVEMPLIDLSTSPVSNKEGYGIKVAAGANLILTFAFKLPNPLIDFMHSKLAAKRVKILEFKHYRDSGSKFWTAHAGFELTFVVPKSALKLVLKKTHSYPEVMLGNHAIRLNVSLTGGCGPTLEYIGQDVNACVGYSAKIIKAVADVSLSPEICGRRETDPAKIYSEYDIKNERRADWLKAAYCKLVKLEKGKKVVILKDASMYGGETFIVEDITKNGARLLLKRETGNYNCHAGRNVIDWQATAAANGVEVRFPAEFSYVGI